MNRAEKNRIRIALLIDRAGSYDRGLIKGIVDYSRLYPSFDFFLEAPSFFPPARENQSRLERLRAWKPDCIIMNECFYDQGYTSLGIPVMVTPSRVIIPGVINILSDDRMLGEMGAEYFIDKGFRNLAFYGTDKIFWSKLRQESFKVKVESSRLNYFQFESLLSDKWQSNVNNVIAWMNDLPKPVAIMACNDEFGIHIIEAANKAGIRVPHEVAILGVDNDEFICDLYDPPMSSIDQEPANVGFKLAQSVRAIITEGRGIDENIVADTFRIISRRSTDVFAVEDHQLVRALMFIKENAVKRSLSVAEVVLATTLSRRVLEIRFRKLLNRSILQEINHIRTEAIIKRLASTKEPVGSIAYSMGFNSIAGFSNYFKHETKLSPVEFRRQFQIK